MKAPYPLVQIQDALAVQKRGGPERERDGGRDTERDGGGQGRERERERNVGQDSSDTSSQPVR